MADFDLIFDDGEDIKLKFIEDPAKWGAIAGNLSDQGDLQLALDNKYSKLGSYTHNGLLKLDSSGNIAQADVRDVDVMKKIDSENYVQGNIPMMGSNGRVLVDSEVSASSVCQKPQSATTGNVAVFDSNRNVVDSEKSLSDFAKSSDIVELRNDLYALDNGINVNVTGSVGSGGGNFFYDVCFIKGSHVKFKNTSPNGCTLNVWNGTEYITIGFVSAYGGSVSFTATHDISKLKCWWNGNDVAFTLTVDGEIKSRVDNIVENTGFLVDSVGCGVKTYEFEQGGLAGSEETVDDARIRTADYIIASDIVVITPQSGYKALIKTYDYNKNVILDGGWHSSEFETTMSDSAYFYRVALARSNDSAISPSSSDKVKIVEKSSNMIKQLRGLTQQIVPSFNYTYDGSPLPINNKFNSSLLMTISYSSGTLNSIAFIDDYIIAYINEINKLRVYSKTDHSVLHEITIDLGHGNCIGVGKKQNDSDSLPLLYVEADDLDGTYNVVRIDSSWNATIVKKYTFPVNVFGYYPQIAWDFENGVCYSIGIDVASQAAVTHKHNVFAISNLNDEVANADDTYTPTLLSQNNMQKLMYIQDVKFYKGKIYIAHSSTTDGSAVSNVYCINLANGAIETRIPAPFAGEIEGVAIYETNGDMRICATNYYNFYELLFN